MHRLILSALAAGVVAASPVSAGTIRLADRQAPVTVSSSGPIGGSLGSAASVGSGAIQIIGIGALLIVGAVLIAANN